MQLLYSDSYDITLKEIVREGEDTFTFRFEAPEAFHWKAGCNAHMLVPGIPGLQDRGEKTWRRHMSLMSTVDEGYIGFTTRIREPRSLFKTRLMNTDVGKRISIYGMKNNFPLERSGRPLVFLSMGVGMATVRPLIREYLADPACVPAFWSINVDRSEAVYRDEMEALEAPGLKVEYCIERGAFQEKIWESLELTAAIYYLVGSDEFLAATAADLVARGIPKDRLRIDKKPHKVKAIMDKI